MKVNGIPTRTIRALDNGSAIEIIDQTLLPYRFEKRILSDWRDGVEAIETMRVRGAPLIGIAGRLNCSFQSPGQSFWPLKKILKTVLCLLPQNVFSVLVLRLSTSSGQYRKC